MLIIVEDQNLVADAYRTSFAREGVSVSGFSSDELMEWISAAIHQDIDAIDAFLFGECSSTQSLVGHVRARCSTPIIAIKEDKSLASTLSLFAAGFDDVIAKLCHVREILARIDAIRRRTAKDEECHVTSDIITFRDGRDPIIGGAPMSLPRRELRILEFLVSRRSRRVTKAQIFSSVYGLFDLDIDENVVESHISKLRKRLRSRLGYDPIESQRHLGYRLIGRSPSLDLAGSMPSESSLESHMA